MLRLPPKRIYPLHWTGLISKCYTRRDERRLIRHGRVCRQHSRSTNSRQTTPQVLIYLISKNPNKMKCASPYTPPKFALPFQEELPRSSVAQQCTKWLEINWLALGWEGIKKIIPSYLCFFELEIFAIVPDFNLHPNDRAFRTRLSISSSLFSYTAKDIKMMGSPEASDRRHELGL